MVRTRARDLPREIASMVIRYLGRGVSRGARQTMARRQRNYDRMSRRAQRIAGPRPGSRRSANPGAASVRAMRRRLPGRNRRV